MASPGDETAGAKSQARLRTSAADREQVIEVLKVAFVQDRITKDELDQRIGKVLTSRTYDDLDILTADIPGAMTGARSAVPARPPDVSKKKLIRRTSVAVAGTSFVIAEPVALAVHLPAVGVIAGLVAGAFTAGLLTVLLTLIAWAIDRNAGRQPSQGPPPGTLDNAAQKPAPDDPAEQPRQSSRRLPPGAETARSGLPRSSLTGLRPPQRLPSLATLALFIARGPTGAGVTAISCVVGLFPGIRLVLPLVRDLRVRAPLVALVGEGDQPGGFQFGQNSLTGFRHESGSAWVIAGRTGRRSCRRWRLPGAGARCPRRR
jgi:hypothetical protein